MQISDMLGQYNRNVSQSTSIAAPTPGVQQLVDAVSDMTVGNIFEGTVNQIGKNQIVLGLSNGETITAKLNTKLSLEVGQSMFFQVKSNNGEQVEIRPYTKGNLNNPTLLKALDAAGIPANERMIGMVDAMMEEQLPIDKQSLWDMARVAAGAPDIDISTLVQMQKLGIPINETMANQFLNYKTDQAAITEQMQKFTDGLPELFSQESMTEQDAVSLNQKILETLSGEEWTFESKVGEGTAEQLAEPSSQDMGAAGQTAAETTGETAAVVEEVTVKAPEEYPPDTLGRLLPEDKREELTQLLRGFPSLTEEDSGLMQDGKLDLELGSKEFLYQLQKHLTGTEISDEASAKRLLSSKAYQTILRNVVEQEWYVKPQELTSKDKVSELYQKLTHQMEQLEQILHNAGSAGTELAKSVTDVHENIAFMNQINQTYNYVQIPLKLSGQNAQSELYVYTNKKYLADPDGELTAFLHLDMEHLGSTDVSIRMHARKVHTDFSLSDDKSYDLIMEHMDELMKRLEEKGYDCTVEVKNQERKVDFVEDFLKQDQHTRGRVHRYSFDVRA